MAVCEATFGVRLIGLDMVRSSVLAIDGLNFNQGDGEAILEDLDVAALSHAEIFRGRRCI